jgi:hypothetical protein
MYLFSLKLKHTEATVCHMEHPPAQNSPIIHLTVPHRVCLWINSIFDIFLTVQLFHETGCSRRLLFVNCDRKVPVWKLGLSTKYAKGGFPRFSLVPLPCRSWGSAFSETTTDSTTPLPVQYLTEPSLSLTL